MDFGGRSLGPDRLLWVWNESLHERSRPGMIAYAMWNVSLGLPDPLDLPTGDEDELTMSWEEC